MLPFVLGNRGVHRGGVHAWHTIVLGELGGLGVVQPQTSLGNPWVLDVTLDATDPAIHPVIEQHHLVVGHEARFFLRVGRGVLEANTLQLVCHGAQRFDHIAILGLVNVAADVVRVP